MYPLIDPFPWNPTYNSPQMAIVDADDKAALSSLYPAANYVSTTGTLTGRVVAKDGTSELTGINVIARRTDQGNPSMPCSRISGDLTQGALGPDGKFTMTGLVPGASYVVYIDQLADGGSQHAQGHPARARGVLELGRERRRCGGQTPAYRRLSRSRRVKSARSRLP
jgi:hypothetical protein